MKADELRTLAADHGAIRADVWRVSAALDAAAGDIERLRTRVESLRGALKSASGWLLDAGDLENAEWCLKQAGDMEL